MVTYSCTKEYIYGSLNPHRAMFKLGGKNLIVLCLLIKIVSAVSSADRCNSKESEKAVWDLNWIGGDISSDKKHNSEQLGKFRFLIAVANWLLSKF